MDLFFNATSESKCSLSSFRALPACTATLKLVLLLVASLLTFSCTQLKESSFSSEELGLLNKYHPSKVVSKNNTEGITATFYGTSSLLFSDKHEAILIDGFFSRPKFPNFIFSKLAQIDVSEIEKILDPSLEPKERSFSSLALKKVVVLHSHYDHAMDATCIANAYGATLIGSQSTLNIKCKDTAAILRQHARKFKPSNWRDSSASADSFVLTMLNSKHSDYGSSLADWALGIGEGIERPLTMPAYFTQFCEGQSYSVLLEHKATAFRILIHGSAGYLPGVVASSVGNNSIDWLFLSIGGLARAEKDQPGFAKRYLTETIDASGARFVVPIHWDDFTRPVSTTLYPPRRRFGNFLAEMRLVEEHINSKEKAYRPKLILLNYRQKITMTKGRNL